jgi:hypothetical protein
VQEIVFGRKSEYETLVVERGSDSNLAQTRDRLLELVARLRPTG